MGVERQRFQSPENLERMVAITAFLAVRLLQLRESQSQPAAQEAAPCDRGLREDEWKVLWVSTERCPPPPSAPSARWAYLALAKLGGFQIPNALAAQAGTPFGTVGFVCKSASRATNSNLRWLNCD